MPKFIIQHSDGSPVDPEARYFVLRVDGDGPKREAARAAVHEYAKCVQPHDAAAAKAARHLLHRMAIQFKSGARGLADA